METKFFEYNQNNSGGSFVEDENLTNHVIIEASSPNDADDKAEAIGIYFDGCERGMDCGCCGDRWSPAYGGGDEIPMIYGTPLVEGQPYKAWIQFTEKVAIIHYADGITASVIVDDNNTLRFVV